MMLHVSVCCDGVLWLQVDNMHCWHGPHSAWLDLASPALILKCGLKGQKIMYKQ